MMSGEVAKTLADILQKKFEFKLEGKRIEKILHHDVWILPNWVFIVEKWGNLYLIFNTSDLTKMLDGHPFDKIAEFYPPIFDVEIVKNEEMLKEVTSGVYMWAREVFPQTSKKAPRSQEVALTTGSTMPLDAPK